MADARVLVWSCWCGDTKPSPRFQGHSRSHIGYVSYNARPCYCSLQAPVVEMTWVIADHVAAAGSQELSVHKGQQVEVLELNTSAPDWCLVRMSTSGSSVDSPPEGLVPLAVLKQPPPGLKTSPSRRAAADHDSGEYFCVLLDPLRRIIDTQGSRISGKPFAGSTVKWQDFNKRMPAFQAEIRIEYDRTVEQLCSNSIDFFFKFECISAIWEHIANL